MTNEDAISRQAVLEGLVSIAKAKAKSDAQKSMMGRTMFFVEQLSPVNVAEKMGRWIPVSEGLPEIHQDVLLFLRSLDIEVGFRAETEPYFYCHGADGCYIEPQNVIAWMPLPEPYKGESEE